MTKRAKLKGCKWAYDDSTESWDTGCGNKHQFMADGPKENEHKFCPYCGGELIERRARKGGKRG